MTRHARSRLLLCAVLLAAAACDYVVIPPDVGGPVGASSKGWTAVATSAGPSSEGDLRIDLTIRNETGAWSAMEATSGAATLELADGSTTACASVFVATGGHRLAPGMQMRGYIVGPKAEPTLELIRVECDGAALAAGATLGLDYSYVTGEYNYYDPDVSRTTSHIDVSLDELAADLSYPIAEPVDGLVKPVDVELDAINGVLLRLLGSKRTETGLEFDWQTENPGEYPTFVHIGLPPVIGADGILYGFYESPDLESVPGTPPGETAEWTTATAVPNDVGGLYLLLSVESKKQRLFVSYAIELGDL